MKKVLFKGIELEGPYVGLTTIFVEGDVRAADILSTIRIEDASFSNTKPISHIYFGAGNRSFVNPETVMTVCTHHNLNVTVEINPLQFRGTLLDILSKFPSGCRFIVAIKTFKNTVLDDASGENHIQDNKQQESAALILAIAAIEAQSHVVWIKVETEVSVFTFPCKGATQAAWCEYNKDKELRTYD